MIPVVLIVGQHYLADATVWQVGLPDADVFVDAESGEVLDVFTDEASQ